MSQAPSSLKVARELSNRLGEAFCTSAFILRGSNKEGAVKGWSAESVEGHSIAVDPLFAATLQSFDTQSSQPMIVQRDVNTFAIVDTGEDHSDTIAVGIVVPNQNETLVRSVISAHIESMQQRSAAEAAEVQIESFIDQVTQDFEELTWLRNANELQSFCGSKHTLESIARKCFPDLAHVIRAESILFIPSKVATNSEAVIADLDRVVATGKPLFDCAACYRFLDESMQFMSSCPRIVNVTVSQPFIPNFPGLRNCIAIPLSKGSSVFGWIMAINRMPSPLEASMLNVTDLAQILPSFGTFEAGLMSAAASMMSSHARNLELFEAQESLTIGVVRAIINAIDAKDAYTFGHSDRVALYAKKIAASLALGDEECERIYMAGLLHDVGKIGIPDSILSKPGKLTDEEFAIVKKHPEIGHNILQHLTQLRYVLPGVLHHHEAVNGTGYPAGLAGEAIPLHGRILAVADAYDAMTSDRPYRAGMPSERAESILRAESGKTWDRDVVAALLDCIANDEIQPHCINTNAPYFDAALNPHVNEGLMNRIGHSINCLTLG